MLSEKIDLDTLRDGQRLTGTPAHGDTRGTALRGRPYALNLPSSAPQISAHRPLRRGCGGARRKGLSGTRTCGGFPLQRLSLDPAWLNLTRPDFHRRKPPLISL